MPTTFKYTITTAGKVDRLLQLIQSNQFFFAFGKPTQWDGSWGLGINDANPPTPTLSTQVVPEIFVYKRAFKVLPVVESGCGEIPFNACSEVSANGRKWTPIDLDRNPRELFNILEPQHIYFHVTLEPQEFLATQYRAVGLYLNPTLKPGVDPGHIFFTPDQIQSPGILYWISFNTPIDKNANKTHEIQILLNV